jgi:Uma2 family endonuclease
MSPQILPPGDWPERGKWTVADWERLPNDGNRYELIDGVLYVTTAPSLPHQWCSGNLYRLLSYHLDAQEPRAGVLFSAPTGVILPTGPVIPDLVYVSMQNLHILTEKRIVGVPDLLIEIASPGTAGYDRREKQDAYARSGVPEYWWVDPGNRTVEVLVLGASAKYRPLGLVDGQNPIPSPQLPGIKFPVESIFMPRELMANLPRE